VRAPARWAAPELSVMPYTVTTTGNFLLSTVKKKHYCSVFDDNGDCLLLAGMQYPCELLHIMVYTKYAA